jgi:hypothetical protein
VPNLIPFVSTMRVITYCQDEVEAQITMDRLNEMVMEQLDEEDGDRVVVTQTTQFTTDVSPEEVLNVLKRARNVLIRTRIKQCFDLARDMDMTIHQLSQQYDAEYKPVYDYGNFITVAERILNKGEDPHE